MIKGFFSKAQVQSKAPSYRVPRCGSCKLYKGCQSPKMPISGYGEKKILLVGEAPGKNEDQQGRQFVGESGEVLRKSLLKLGVDMREDCWLTNALICRPPNNKDPSDKQIAYCRPNLTNAIDELSPNLIIPMGKHAVKSLIGEIWKEDVGNISRWVGFRIPCQTPNVWICPNYHPSFVLRSEGNREGELTKMLFESRLKGALELKGKPWDDVPDLESKVEILYNTDEAAHIIRKMVEKGGEATFDYETNMLKPDSEKARIVCCSVCWEGKKTIAFPWEGEVIEAMGEFFKSDRIEKLGQNIKFEHRWTMKEFGHGVRKWKHDAMLAAHWIDNRRGITSAKFQAFVLLGQPSYNDYIEPFLQSKSSNEPNRIDQIAMSDLLLYCGMDSLVEFLITIRQREYSCKSTSTKRLLSELNPILTRK